MKIYRQLLRTYFTYTLIHICALKHVSYSGVQKHTARYEGFILASSSISSSVLVILGAGTLRRN